MEYVISSCLLGIKCRYNGGTQLNSKIYNLFENGFATPICPEVLGGLPIPRLPAELTITDRNVKAVNINGADVTEQFTKGAEIALSIANLIGATKAILKSKSPSCGNCSIYSGNFSGELIDGEGVTAKLFRENGIIVTNEHDWD